MAIYLNDKILKADPKGNKLEREYAAGLERVSELFEKFRIKDSKSSYIQIARNVKDNERVFSMTSHKEKRLPTIALPVEVPYYDDEMGATLVRYSTTPPQKTPAGNLTWATKYLEFREMMTITDKQKDLAWFLLFASNLIKKGVYKLVDVQAKYEGTWNEIIVKKDVIDYLTGGDEELVRHIARKFLNESIASLEVVEVVVKLNSFIEDNKQWEPVLEEIKKYNSSNILKKENVSIIEWEGEPIEMLKCPSDIKNTELKDEAASLGIKITFPPQTKNVLYSLIQHVKARK
jgi:hypothetical protein